jgi:hypothetical protein
MVRWIAEDKNGDAYLYEVEPEKYEKLGWWAIANGSKDFYPIKHEIVLSLIGKLINWEDEGPVKINIEIDNEG